MKPWIARLLAAALLAGCTTLEEVSTGMSAPKLASASFEVRDKSYDRIWGAVQKVAGRELTIVESVRDTGTLRAEKPGGLASGGEVVSVFVRPSTEGAKLYTVEVQSLNRSKLPLAGKDWVPTLTSGIKAELGE